MRRRIYVKLFSLLSRTLEKKQYFCPLQSDKFIENDEQFVAEQGEFAGAGAYAATPSVVSL